MRYFAILADSLQEALDRKSLYVMLAVAAFFILVVAGISFSPMSTADAVRDMTSQFSTVVFIRGTAMTQQKYSDVQFEVADFKELGADAGDFADGFQFALKVHGVKEFHHLVRHWDAAERRLLKSASDPIPLFDVPVDEELEVKFLRERYREKMIPKREIARIGATEDRRDFAVRIRPSSRATLEGAYRMSVFFGVTSFRLETSVAFAVFLMEYTLSEWMAGLFGIFVAIVVTAGFVPGMLQKGTLDVLLSKPVHRSTLLLYKYLGGLTYATLTGGAFIGGSWLVLSLRSGIWNWGYLATLGTLMFFFAVLYSIGVFVAVLSKSTIMAIVFPLGAWAIGSGINKAKAITSSPLLGLDVPKWIPTSLEGLSWLFPRSGDINLVNVHFMLQGSLGPEIADFGRQTGVPEIDWVRILASSGALLLAFLTASCWVFSKRDY